MDEVTQSAIKWLTGLLGAIAASLLGFWGDLGNLLPWLGLAIMVDIVSGFVAAGVGGQIDSRIAWRGMARKTYTLLLVVACQILEVVYSEVQGSPPPFDFSNMAAGFFIVTETISIVENAGRAGVPLPPWLRDVLALLNGKARPPGGGP